MISGTLLWKTENWNNWSRVKLFRLVFGTTECAQKCVVGIFKRVKFQENALVYQYREIAIGWWIMEAHTPNIKTVYTNVSVTKLLCLESNLVKVMGYKNEREGRHTAAAPWFQGSHGQPPHLISLHHPPTCYLLLPSPSSQLVRFLSCFCHHRDAVIIIHHSERNHKFLCVLCKILNTYLIPLNWSL